MKRHLHISLAALLLGLTPAAGCSGKKNAPSGDFKPAPQLELVQLGGEDFDLADYKGRVVLLNMWATWCKPCREELPELARLHRELEPRGLTVVGVNVDVARLRRKVGRMVEDFACPSRSSSIRRTNRYRSSRWSGTPRPS